MLFAITQNRKIGSFSVVFWTWSKPDFLYIFDEMGQPDGLRVLDEKRIAIFGKKRLKIYDTQSVQCTYNTPLEKNIQELHLLPHSKILLLFEDESFSSLDLNQRKIESITTPGLSNQYLYLKYLQILIDSTDIHDVKKIEL